MADEEPRESSSSSDEEPQVDVEALQAEIERLKGELAAA
jgi:hypothetical protein